MRWASSRFIGLLDITRVPRTEAYICGVINLRGKVIPIVDLRVKFGMEPTAATDQTVIIVVQYAIGTQEMTMGVLVDEVVEVYDIGGADIEPPPRRRRRWPRLPAGRPDPLQRPRPPPAPPLRRQRPRWRREAVRAGAAKGSSRARWRARGRDDLQSTYASQGARL